ncbi:unnamed protein product [Durusdinium trenchii]|uniref:Uncharacterized protein n=1 Tax=Durusdinium trenchii TaxID=1381693 RepID=A0ABP0PKW5_9DINO
MRPRLDVMWTTAMGVFFQDRSIASRSQRCDCCVQFNSEDGTLYLWGSTEIDGSPHLLRIMQEENTDRPGISSKEAVAISWSKGAVLLGTMSGRLLLWNLESGKILKIFRGHRSCVDVVRVSWKTSQALSACRDRVIRNWRMETGECTLLRGHTSSVCCLLVNWELRRVVSAGLMDGLRLWTLDSRQCLSQVSPAEGPLGPAETRVICCDVDWQHEKAVTGSGSGLLALWDLNLLKVLWRRDGHGHGVHAVSLQPGGQRCLSATESSVCIWDQAGELQCRIPGVYEQACLVLDWQSLWLFCASDAVWLYDMQELKEAKVLCELRGEHGVSLSCGAVEWPHAIHL